MEPDGRAGPDPARHARHTAPPGTPLPFSTKYTRLPRSVAPSNTDLFIAQRFARHASPLTTVIYTHPSDQEMFERLRGMEC